MLTNSQITQLDLYTYWFIEALHNTELDKSKEGRVRLYAAYSKYKGFIEGLLNRYFNYPTIPTSLVSVTILTRWIVGLTTAIKLNHEEQLDSCAKVIIQTMEGNFNNVQN